MPDAVARTSLNELTRSSEASDEEDSISIVRIPQTGRLKGGTAIRTQLCGHSVAEPGFESQVVKLQCPELGVHVIPPVTVETYPLTVLI